MFLNCFRPEALFMLIMYVVYCVTLSYNARLERWAKSYNIPFLPKDEEPAEQTGLVTYKSLQEERQSYTAPEERQTYAEPESPIDPWKAAEGNQKVNFINLCNFALLTF